MAKTVLVNGCWDPTHIGHLLHLRSAKQMGDTLVVSITSDEAVRREKGAGRPLFNEHQRADFLGALRCVDWTVIVPGPLEALQLVKPDIFVKGPDYVNRIGSDVAAFCKERGIKIAFTRDRKWSATDLVHELRRG